MKKRMGSWWEKIPAIFLVVLIIVLLVLAGAFLAVMCCDSAEKYVVQLLGLQVPGTEVSKKHEALKFLGIGMGGFFIALQALMSYKRATAMEDAANAQAKATEHQARANQTTEQGQRQERLKNAIEHLGHKSDSVRLGGAYELFHLAQDTPELRQTVLDILCAHIRRTTGEPEYRDKHQSKPSEEIQSLLTLLFVQEHKVFTGLHINLQESWLNGSDLDQARLEKAVLVRAHLHGAQLVGAHLHKAQLVEAHLHEADLEGAQLYGADLRAAHLHGAQLVGAHLHKARLWGAHLHEANLIGAHLHGASLRGARLHGADLGGAQLYGSYLWGAQLHGAQMMGAHLHGADLRAAQLYGASLEGAQLYGAYLWGAHLHGADLRAAQLHGASSGPKLSIMLFEASIKERIGKESDLSGAIFAGGLTQEDVDSIGTGLADEEEKRLREKLAEHIGGRKSCALPENSDAVTGAYTKEEAAQWIAEYKAATKAVSGSD